MVLGYITNKLWWQKRCSTFSEKWSVWCTLLYRPEAMPRDAMQLQGDQDELVKWSERWQMPFNTAKCKVIHLGATNNEHKVHDGRQRAGGDHWRERPWNSYRCISVIPCSGSLSSEEGLPHSRYHMTHLPEPGWDHSTTAFQVNGEATTWIWEVCVGSCVLWWPRQSWTSAKMGHKNGCLCQTSAISNKTGGTEASKHAL